jgi:hypothetical protein
VYIGARRCRSDTPPRIKLTRRVTIPDISMAVVGSPSASQKCRSPTDSFAPGAKTGYTCQQRLQSTTSVRSHPPDTSSTLSSSFQYQYCLHVPCQVLSSPLLDRSYSSTPDQGPGPHTPLSIWAETSLQHPQPLPWPLARSMRPTAPERVLYR